MGISSRLPTGRTGHRQNFDLEPAADLESLCLRWVGSTAVRSDNTSTCFQVIRVVIAADTQSGRTSPPSVGSTHDIGVDSGGSSGDFAGVPARAPPRSRGPIAFGSLGASKAGCRRPQIVACLGAGQKSITKRFARSADQLEEVVARADRSDRD